MWRPTPVSHWTIHGTDSLSACLFTDVLPHPYLLDSCTYRLEKEDLVVSELFQLLDSVRDRIGIVDWGIKMTTMEDGWWNFEIIAKLEYYSILIFCSFSHLPFS